MEPGSFATRGMANVVVAALLASVGLVAADDLAQSKPSSRRALTGFVMTDSTIRTAVAAWVAGRSGAEATYGHISTWNTGGVTDMESLFCASSTYCGSTAASKASFNDDISAWDTTGVTTMAYMFMEVASFNQPLNGWNVAKVTDMVGTFQSASAFNQPPGGWNANEVTSMANMFLYASSFDQDLGWCVKTGVDLAYAFKDAGCASTSCGVVQGGCPTPVPTTRAPTASPAPVAVSITDEGHCLHCYVYLSILFACLVL